MSKSSKDTSQVFGPEHAAANIASGYIKLVAISDEGGKAFLEAKIDDLSDAQRILPSLQALGLKPAHVLGVGTFERSAIEVLKEATKINRAYSPDKANISEIAEAYNAIENNAYSYDLKISPEGAKILQAALAKQNVSHPALNAFSGIKKSFAAQVVQGRR